MHYFQQSRLQAQVVTMVPCVPAHQCKAQAKPGYRTQRRQYILAALQQTDSRSGTAKHTQ